MSQARYTCPTCAHHNRAGVLLCENCGTNLLTGDRGGIGTHDLRGADEEGRALEWASTELDDENLAVLTSDMLLRLEIDGTDVAIVIRPDRRDIIFGRHDPTTGTTPEVDLTRYAGFRMGVSRHHAALRLSDREEVIVLDLGSHNGTFINGVRLVPHRPYTMRSGDTLGLGQLVLHVHFQSEAD